jgi:isopentenyl-diphosphate delta-isomerase
MLHRAFSIFLFADPQTVLLHRRSAEKPLWPGFWTNSCCSHPRRGEDNDTATRRRLEQELGVQATLKYLYKFEYHAQFGALGAEHELCSVYVGALRERDAPRVNRSEIAEWGWFTLADINAWLAREPESFTPWFKLEWAQLLAHHRPAIEALFDPQPARVSASAP